ncbi:RNA-guided endonuclease TnpB family protein [Enterococcus dispar]|nr:RNA-guided endonuclease TnpB family protein [Enterococcus dispar]EOT40233.1 hypothetical protein OMK_02085 [Enterococcus dispar ATCC 51266]EOW86484.1 hypothetical protein I569_01819 [Enterococcus dispar ATCC 51266]MCU7357398.1 RNA-guided endonuclease TnpB family protein [Enterococcus dispar]MDT2706018.1 transposase [Enterococcus dispar]OJG39553.1 hypothetical protein RV01_GL001500 [Enterococcus dispar]
MFLRKAATTEGIISEGRQVPIKTLKAYRFALYPDEAQKHFFIQTFGCVRFTYNMLLTLRQQESGKTVEERTSARLQKQKMTPAKLKKDYPFLKATDSLALANAQRNLEKAFQNYYRGRASYPKLKSKKSAWQSYTTNNQGHTIYLAEDGLKLPKLKSKVLVHQHRSVAGKIRSATISAKNRQEFYVSLLCEEDIPALPKTGSEIEIAYDPTGLVVTNKPIVGIPTFCQTQVLEKLKKAQRRLSCRAKSAQRRNAKLEQAKNYQKQKSQVQQLYIHKLKQKEDFTEQLSIALLRQFDCIIITKPPELRENKESKAAKTVKKSKHTTVFPSFEDNFTLSDWNRLLLKLKYKAEWYEKELVFICPTNGK